MRNILLVIFSLFTLCISGYALAGDEKALLKEVVAMLDRAEKDNFYWPEYKINSHPIVLSVCNEGDEINKNEECDLYAFNFKPKSKDWKKIAVDGHDVYYNPNDVYGISDQSYASLDGWDHYSDMIDVPRILIKAPYLMIDDQLAYVNKIYLISDMKKNYLRNEALRVMGRHLQAHLISDAQKASEQLKAATYHFNSGYDGFRKTENVVLLNIEKNLMSNYLENPKEETLKNFVALEVVRRSSSTINNLNYEYNNLAALSVFPYVRLLDINEASDAIKYHAPFDILFDCNDDNYTNLRNYINGILPFINAVSMLALEHIDATWKLKINTQMASIQELLIEYYKMPQSEINKRAAATKLLYHYDETKKKLDEKFQQELRLLDIELNNYQNTPGIEIHYIIPALVSEIPYYYNSEIVDAETTLITNEGNWSSKYIRDLVYKNIKYFKKRSDVLNSIDVYEFKIPSSSIITIDGEKTTVSSLLATSKKIEFKSVSVEGNEPSSQNPISFYVSRDKTGTIDTTSGTLEIILSSEN